MSPASSISRLRHYHRKNGTHATLWRIATAFQRAYSAGRMELYSCDLPVADAPVPLGTLERKPNAAMMKIEEKNRICSHWNPDLTRRLMEERFAATAELWLLRWNGTIAAYGWTLRGKTIEPHYFPIEAHDTHLFDFFVFPQFRGRGINPSLIWQILVEIGDDGSRRAFIEAAAWNRAQLASLAKTPFKKLGAARKFRLGKRPLVLWSQVGLK